MQAYTAMLMAWTSATHSIISFMDMQTRALPLSSMPHVDSNENLYLRTLTNLGIRRLTVPSMI